MFDRKRTRFTYEENYTAALALPYSTEQLSRSLGNEQALLALSEQHIKEHANRRVDLFFYTLIAYYRTSILAVEGHTNLQHGKGRTLEDHTSVTQACHSSLIPSLLDKTIYQNRQNQAAYKSMLSGTHFLESLNSTVELPAFVNAFDDLLEAACRAQCMDIIREVALGTVTPVQGLARFLSMMDTLLQQFMQQATSGSCSSPPLGHHYVNPHLIELVIKGTLATTFSVERDTVNDDYIQLMLRMTPPEQLLCRRFPKNKEKIYEDKMLQLQHEILETESEERSCTI